MTLAIKRAYEAPAKDDGYRVLVERLWRLGLRYPPGEPGWANRRIR